MEDQLNILLLIGIAVFIGLNGGKIFQKMKIPQVVGYIIIGVLLGDSVFGLFRKDVIEVLAPLNSFALGLIGFMIGGELKLDIFKKYGNKFLIILLFEGLVTFFLVTFAVTYFTGKLYLGVIFGALASATAPAATVDVLWEYKSKGLLTTAILAIVALDDGLALILYGFSHAFAKTLLTGGDFSFFNGFVIPLFEIGASIGLGLLVGYVLYRMILKVTEKEQLLVLSVGAILVNTGFCSIFDLDLILANMAMGVVLSNKVYNVSKLLFDVVKGFTPPIYVLFFVLVGARLQINLIPQMGALGVIYLVARSFGKLSGSYLGAVVSKSDDVIRKYLGMSLFSQAGVAIGLAIAIYQSFSKLGPEGEAAGALILNVVTATTFIVQLIGPSCVKVAITKAGETGKDITEEDILNSYKVKQVMESRVDIINANETLSKVINIIRMSEHVYLPVVDKGKSNEFIGVLSFQNIKDAMFEHGIGELILAREAATEDVITSFKGEELKSAMDKFMYVNLNYLPVLENENSRQFAGIIHKRTVAKVLKEDMIGKLVETKKEMSVQDSKGTEIFEMINIKNIKLDLKSRSKKDAIYELTELLSESEEIKDKQQIYDKLLERESQTTTGIGDGIAIPHARTSAVKKITIAFGRSKGINFQSVDNKSVKLIFMVVIPADHSESTLQVMSQLSRLLRNKEFKESLLVAGTCEEILELIKNEAK